MEYQKITNLLGTTPNEMPRFITKKWVEVNDQSGDANDRYKPNKPIRFKTSMSGSDLCDFSGAYIVVKGKITVTDPNNDGYDKKIAFKNNASFVSCISKINNTLTMQKIKILLCPYTICLNTAKIIQKQQEVFEITTEMNQIVVQITT